MAKPKKLITPEKRLQLMSALGDPDNYAPKITAIGKALGVSTSTVYERHKNVVHENGNPFVPNQKRFVVKPKNLSAIIETLDSNGGKVIGAEMSDDGDFEVVALIDAKRTGLEVNMNG